jgi:hypothetical protein
MVPRRTATTAWRFPRLEEARILCGHPTRHTVPAGRLVCDSGVLDGPPPSHAYRQLVTEWQVRANPDWENKWN